MDGKTNLSLLIENAKKNLALFRRLNDPRSNEMANTIEHRISKLQIVMMNARQEVEDYASVGVENRDIVEVDIWNKYWKKNKDFHQQAEKTETALIEEIIISKREIPNEFVCPISLSIMIDPVSLKFDGIVENKINYEKSNIIEWLREHNYDPITKAQPVNMSNYVPNEELTTQITMFLNSTMLLNSTGLGKRRRTKRRKKRRQIKQIKRRTKRRQKSKNKYSKRIN
jgi:hypothetical protein